MQVYTESTDGSYLDVKESALVWHYKDADPDFGRWQAKVRHTLPADYICFLPCHQCKQRYSQQQARAFSSAQVKLQSTAGMCGTASTLVFIKALDLLESWCMRVCCLACIAL